MQINITTNPNNVITLVPDYLNHTDEIIILHSSTPEAFTTELINFLKKCEADHAEDEEYFSYELTFEVEFDATADLPYFLQTERYMIHEFMQSKINDIMMW